LTFVFFSKTEAKNEVSVERVDASLSRDQGRIFGAEDRPYI